MRITDLLRPEAIQLHASPSDKSSAIDLLVDLHARAGNISDKEAYKKEIWAREGLDSTAVGDGVAVPHARCAAVKRASLAAITVPNGLDYDSPDGEPSRLFFMIAAPEGAGDVHMDMLAHLMVMLMDEDFCRKLLDTRDVKTFLELIDAQERAKYPDEAPAPAEQPQAGLRVLAITACPTGIAHTYMAAEALEKKGRELNIGVKAETQGSGGAKNILIYPVVGLLFIGAFMCLVNPVVGMINNALIDALNSMGGTSAVLLGALVAGMQATDMGGPINKAAYVFGTASIAMAAGGFSPVMAAVMAGGMVPPIAIALATIFFKDRFTENERYGAAYPPPRFEKRKGRVFYE